MSVRVTSHKEKTMKKYIAFGVAVVLLVLAFIVPNSFSKGIEAGKGDGKNEKISNFDEIVDLLVATEKLTQGKTKNFESLTFNVVYDSARDYTYTATGVSNATKISMKSDSTVHLTSDAQYIVSHIVANTQTTESDKSQSVYVEFDFETYSKGETQLVRISNFETIGDGLAFTDKEKGVYLNRWLEFDETASDVALIPTLMLYGITSPVYSLVSSLSDYQERHFEKTGDKYAVVERKFKELSETFALSVPFVEGVETTGEVFVDTSKAKKPTLVAEFEYELPETYKMPSLIDESVLNYKITSGINFEKYEVTFSNINNTEIKYDLDDDDIYNDEELIELLKDNGLWVDPAEEETDDETQEGDEDGEEVEE